MNQVARVAAALWLLGTGSAWAEWKILAAEPQSTGRAGVVQLTTSAEESGTGTKATLHLAIFPMKTATLRVIDNGANPDASVADTMKREQAIAGVNGGYFDPDYGVVGLLISDGRVVAPQQKARLLSGVVSVSQGRVQVQRAAEFSLKSKPSAARQCGPFLVERGQAVPGLNDGRRARRTFVLVAGERAAIGYCSSVTLAQLGNLLATPGATGDLKTARALNLDGGSSSGFWCNGSDGVFSVREGKTVRDFLAIVPR